MKRYLRSILPILCLSFSFAQADSNIFAYSSDKPISEVYDKVYRSLEDARFYVVFEPNIGNNLSKFAERWGDQYNRSKLSAIRSTVFCNGWYANQVSNADPDMLALCPLHITLVEQGGSTRILFVKPSAVAQGSEAEALAGELEQAVADAIAAALQQLGGSPAAP